jgi:hypothetical protein
MVLAKPIAEISQQIQTNIKLAGDKKKELESGKFDKDIKDLEKKMRIPQQDLKSKPLGFPRTVCTDSNCITKIGVGEKTKVNYTQWCHPQWYYFFSLTEKHFIYNDQKLCVMGHVTYLSYCIPNKLSFCIECHLMKKSSKVYFLFKLFGRPSN